MAGPTFDVELSEEQKGEGYWTEPSGNNILVWHGKNQIALLHGSADINSRVQDLVERRRRELKEIEARTGWKADR